MLLRQCKAERERGWQWFIRAMPPNKLAIEGIRKLESSDREKRKQIMRKAQKSRWKQR